MAVCATDTVLACEEGLNIDPELRLDCAKLFAGLEMANDRTFATTPHTCCPD